MKTPEQYENEVEGILNDFKDGLSTQSETSKLIGNIILDLMIEVADAKNEVK